MTSDKNTLRVVPKQDHDGLLDLSEAIAAVQRGYRDRADDEKQLMGVPRQRIVDPDSGTRMSNFAGLSPRSNAGGILFFSKQVALGEERQEEYGHTGTMYVMFDEERCEYEGIVIGEIAPAEFPSLARRTLNTSLETTVGTDVLAREDASELGIFGTGRQARAHLQCFTEIRELEHIRVYSPTPEHRDEFVSEMSGEVDSTVEAVDSPVDVIEGVDIVLCATNTNTPIFDGDLLEPGQHVSSIVGSEGKLVEAGLTSQRRREIDDTTIQRSDRYVANSVWQAKQDQQGDFYLPVQSGVIDWDDIIDLPEILRGAKSGRETDDEITVYKQNSIQGMTQVALLAALWERIKEHDLGTEIEWFDPRGQSE